MNLKKLAVGMLIGTGMTTMVACDGATEQVENEGKANIRISMVDAPGDYEHIYIAVEALSIRSGGNWIDLPVAQVDTFDILDYTDGSQLFLAQAPITADSTDEIRFVLAEGSTLVLQDSSVHELTIPSSQTSGLKIKLDTMMVTQGGANYHIILDFDADKSIVKRGNGTYLMKPVIRGYWEEGLGSVDGIALSPGYQVAVSALFNGDTLGGTIADTTGYYYVGGLPAGTYSFYYSSSNGLDSTVNGIAVQQNVTTPIDTVSL